MHHTIRIGVYRITNTVNGKFYVGASKRLDYRLYSHKWKLQKGIHGNLDLQADWLEYGSEAFAFEILEEFSVEELLAKREQHWMDHLNAVEKGYNVCAVVGSSVRSRPLAESTRKKISEAARELMADPVIKKRHSEGTKRGMADPELRKRLSEKAKARFDDPAYKAMVLDRLKKANEAKRQ